MLIDANLHGVGETARRTFGLVNTGRFSCVLHCLAVHDAVGKELPSRSLATLKAIVASSPPDPFHNG